MPYPNYHSARIISPKKFKKYAYKKIGKGIDLVLGIDEDSRVVEATHVQAYRFDKNKWTPEAAKAWLKKHGKKYISFHTATVKEDAGPAGIPTVTTTSADIARFPDKVGPMVSRQGDRKKKKTLRETLEYIVNGTKDS